MTDGYDLAVLLIRVVVGLMMSAHGLNKFFGGGKIAGTARWFDSMGMKPNGKIHAYMAATTEVACGWGFALGLLTPLTAAGITGVMVVAAWTHRQNGFFIVKDGYEYNLVVICTVIAVATMGPGRWSLDNALGIDVFLTNAGVSFAIAAGLGLGSGFGLLAACYRPPAPKDA